jgi:hypothetical protein
MKPTPSASGKTLVVASTRWNVVTAAMKEGVRGIYAERYKEGTNLVLLEDDVAAVFHNDREVNEALRSLIRIARTKAKHAA